MKIGILDYGVGNIQSVINMFFYLGVEIQIISNKHELSSVKKLILPGVGNFDHLVTELKARDLFCAIQAYGSGDNFLLGICAGMQVLFETSEEGKLGGLSLLKGGFSKLDNNLRLPIPNMGWNIVDVKKENSLLGKEGADLRFYFAHSYGLLQCSPEIEVASINYGQKVICAVQKNNIFGVQFHPEKSHRYGLELFQRFIQLGN